MSVCSSFRLGTLELKNRFVMAPMTTNLANKDNSVSPQLTRYYRRAASGGAGLIIVEATSVSGARLHARIPLGIHHDCFVSGLRELAQGIKEEGRTAFIQLVDAMCNLGKVPTDLTTDEIYQIRDDFVSGAERAFEARFQGIELHMAHRYTLADFLSKRANRRNDEFGNGFAGRIRLPLLILREIRKKLGEGFPIICRINGDDFVGGGNTIIDALKIARVLEEAGADAIHVSAGGRLEEGGDRSYSCYREVPPMGMPDALNVYLAEAVKKVVRVPIIAVGKIRKPETAKEIVRSGKADLVALGRALLSDPFFPKKVCEGREGEIKLCIYCNDCMRLVLRGDPIECLRGELSFKKRKRAEN